MKEKDEGREEDRDAIANEASLHAKVPHERDSKLTTTSSRGGTLSRVRRRRRDREGRMGREMNARQKKGEREEKRPSFMEEEEEEEEERPRSLPPSPLAITLLVRV